MTKKLLSLLVAVLMVLALVPMGALAKAEAEVESFNKITQRVRLNDGFRFAESRTKAGVTDSRDTEYVCDGSVYSFDFETSYSSEGWWTYDRDSTNYTYDNWLQNSGFGVDDSVAMISLSYYNGVGAMNQDNWLISPEITVPQGTGIRLGSVPGTGVRAGFQVPFSCPRPAGRPSRWWRRRPWERPGRRGPPSGCRRSCICGGPGT